MQYFTATFTDYAVTIYYVQRAAIREKKSEKGSNCFLADKFKETIQKLIIDLIIFLFIIIMCFIYTL